MRNKTFETKLVYCLSGILIFERKYGTPRTQPYINSSMFIHTRVAISKENTYSEGVKYPTIHVFIYAMTRLQVCLI